MRFSVIIPTLNEAARLQRVLQAAQAAFGAQAEYIVSDGGSTDATCEIARLENVRVLRGPSGRGAQLQHAVEHARGDVCVFVHADTLMPAVSLAAIERALADPGAVGGAFLLEFNDLPHPSFLLRLLQAGVNLRTRFFHSATGDQMIFVRRSVLEDLGGVPRVPLFEDVRLCRAMKRRGRFVVLEERVITSARMWREAGVLRGIFLHWSFRALHALGASPVFLARHYPSAR